MSDSSKATSIRADSTKAQGRKPKTIPVLIPTVNDIARHAGVSLATVDRVLNERPGVRSVTMERVQKAVNELGYVRNIAAANLAKSRTYRLAFVIPHRGNDFFARMHEHLDKAMPHLDAARVAVDVIDFKAFEPKALEQALATVAESSYDGIAIAGLRHKRVKTQLKKLQDTGTRIVSLVSDLPDDCRQHYIGIDNDKAGRSAARLLGMAHAGNSGKVIVTVGSLDAIDHFERLDGFRSVLGRDFDSIKVVETIETRDNPRLMREALIDKLTELDGVTAIYNVGAGNEGLIEALRIVKREDRLFCIVHELSAATRRALEEGTIDIAIDQRPELELNRALSLLRSMVDDLPAQPVPELIPSIFLRDNLPDDIPNN